MTHTPGPWKIDINYDVFIESSDGLTTICTVGDPGRPEQSEHDAQFIIKACNAHEELVKQLHRTIEYAEKLQQALNLHERNATLGEAKGLLATIEKGA